MEKGKMIINGVEVGGSFGSATSVPYSNTNSGLEATNVQGAIDELNSNLTKRATAIRVIGICVNGEVIVPYLLPVEHPTTPTVSIVNGAISGVSTDTTTSVQLDASRTNTDQITFKLKPTNGASITNGACYLCMVYFLYE